MDKKKRLMGLATLSAAFATTFVLMVTLPITVYGNQESSAQTKFFDGLNTSTKYLVGSDVKLSVNNVTNPDNYDYLWYMKTQNNAQPQYLKGYSGPSIDLANASNLWNNAMIYCVLVLKPQNSPTNPAHYLMNNGLAVDNNANGELLGDAITENDVALWTQTKLELSAAFEVTNCEISAQQVDGVKVDTADKVILAPVNQDVTLTASATFDKVYAPYIKYIWYKGNEEVQNSSSNTFTIKGSTTPTTAEYHCVAQLVSGASISNQLASSTYKLNVVQSTNLAAGNTSTKVVGNTGATLNKIPAGNTVNLTANFTLAGQALESNNKDYTVSYAWTQNNKPVTNANSNTLTLANTTTEMSGSYICTATISFTNGGKLSVSSNPITVNIVTPGTISISKNLEYNLKIANGASTTLSVSATLINTDNQDQALNYKWQYKTKGSTTWTNVENKGQAYNNSKLPLTAQQVVDMAGAQFQCVISDTNKISQVKPVTTNTLTLDVINPELSVNATISNVSNPSGSKDQLLYGQDVTLTATPTVTNQSDLASGNTVDYKYSYQWYKSTNNGQQWTEVSTNGNSATLTITNLTNADNGTQYECKVTPTNVLVPSNSAPKAKSNDVQQDAPAVTNEFTTTSNVVTLNIQPFGFTATALATPVVSGQPEGQQPTASATLKNNLGDKFTVSLNIKTTEPYSQLPYEYQYVYKWVQSTSESAPEESWTPIQSGTSSQLNPGQIQSTTAGTIYYRCYVSIAKKVVSESITGKSIKLVELTKSPVIPSSIITIQTLPGLNITNTGSNSVSIAHNGKASLTPNIEEVMSLEPVVTKKVATLDTTSSSSIAQYNPIYSWSFTPSEPTGSKEVVFNTENVGNYKFIEGNSYQTATLEMNTLDDKTNCNGQYSLTVTINGHDYKLATPYTVTESAATFNVNATATAKLGATSISLTANPQAISNQDSAGGSQGSTEENGNKDQPANKSRTARNAPSVSKEDAADSSYKYTWYVVNKNDGNKLEELTNLTDNTNTTQTLQLPKGTVQQNWNNNLSFYCEVENTKTGEIEWNTAGANLQVQDPKINTFSVTEQGSSTVNYNTSVTLSAKATTDFTVGNNQVSYQWQYYDAKSTNWVNIKGNDSTAQISTLPSNVGSQLKLMNVNGPYEGLKIRCVASYFGATDVISSNEITIHLKQQELSSVTTGTLEAFAKKIQTAFQASNLDTTLSDIYGNIKTGYVEEPQINGSVITEWLNEILGKSNISSNQLKTAFGENAIQLTAYPVAEQARLSAHPKAKSVAAEESQEQPQLVQPTYKTVLKFTITALDGYTWPSNLSAQVNSKQGNSSYQTKVSGQQLIITIPTNLQPGFTITPSSSTSINLSSTNELTATVKATQSLNSFTWYAQTSTGNVVTLLEGGQPTKDFTDLFGESATYKIVNSGSDAQQSSTLTISNITGLNKLNNVKLYAVGTVDKKGQYWQQQPSLTPFTIAYQTALSSDAVHSVASHK